MTEVFAVLAEPHRRRILDLVREEPRTVGELATRLGISQPGTSRHLRILREAGLVEARPEGQRRVYRLRSEPLEELDAWLQPYRWMWEARFDVLETQLRKMAGRNEAHDRTTTPPQD